MGKERCHIMGVKNTRKMLQNYNQWAHTVRKGVALDQKIGERMYVYEFQ